MIPSHQWYVHHRSGFYSEERDIYIYIRFTRSHYNHFKKKTLCSTNCLSQFLLTHSLTSKTKHTKFITFVQNSYLIRSNQTFQEFHSELNSIISKNFEDILNSPISSNLGIYSSLNPSSFLETFDHLNHHHHHQSEEIESRWMLFHSLKYVLRSNVSILFYCVFFVFVFLVLFSGN